MSSSSIHDSKPKNDLKIAKFAVVCNETKLRGDITIGAQTIVHPRASIIAEAGPIIIGDHNIIEEQAHIINRLPPGTDPSTQIVMEIGSNNVFEVDSLFEASKMGDQNVLEVKCEGWGDEGGRKSQIAYHCYEILCQAHVGPSIEITNGCVVGAGCILTGKTVLPENTVVYGQHCERRVAIDKPPLQNLQIEFLSKVLVNYHHLKKPRNANS